MATLLFALWQVLMSLALPLVFARLWWRGRIDPRYRDGWGERLGRGAPRPGRIWIHAVSVGEAQAALRIVEASELPVGEFLFTTATPTGRHFLLERLPTATVQLAPLDWWPAVRFFLDRQQPRLLMLIETELWPGWIRAARNRRTPVMLANARLSERAAARYRRAGELGREMFAGIDRCLCIAEQDAERFVAVGVPADRVDVTGNVKADNDRAGQPLSWLSDLPPTRIIAASTHPGEETLALDALGALRDRVAEPIGLLLAPRRPERSGECAAAAAARGLRTRLRSAAPLAQGADVVVLDTLGELAETFAGARCALVGGTWAPIGGHTPLEPAGAGVPVIVGEETFKITALVGELREAGGLVVCPDAESIADQLCHWLTDESSRVAAGAAALGVAQRHRGAAGEVATTLQSLLPSASRS